MAFLSSLKRICLSGSRQYSCCIGLNDVYIISATRTPIGCFQGRLSSFNAVQLATKALSLAVQKSGICKDDIHEIILGSCFQAGLGQAPAHQVALFAGLTESIVSCCVSRACGSGMKAVMLACNLIGSNAQEVVAVGGTESLTNAPYLLKRKKMKIGNLCLSDIILHDGLVDMFNQLDVTHYAEEVAKEFKITRNDQDEYALKSYAKAAKAREDNVFAAEMVPLVLEKKGGQVETICDDEEIGRLDVEKFRNLKPEIGEQGTITVGNASGLHDGASMLILASGNYVLKKNLTPIAKIVSCADASVDIRKFIIAPSVAIPKALVKANLTTEQIHRWEISETFAATPIANIKILKLNPDLVNIYGGAISLGHPFGYATDSMTGPRLITHLSHTLSPGQFGCASMCYTPGGGAAVIVEKMN